MNWKPIKIHEGNATVEIWDVQKNEYILLTFEAVEELYSRIRELQEKQQKGNEI